MDSVTIIFISKDVFFWPIVKSAIPTGDARLVIAPRLESEKLSDLLAEQVKCCLIDLAAVAIADLPPLVTSTRSRFPSASVVAFGSHVQDAKLQAAQQAGCDQVLTRGQLNANASELVRQWLHDGTK